MEKHNALLGLAVSKTMNDTISAKNSLNNVHRFLASQLVFGRNPNFPYVCDKGLPAVESRAIR